MKSKSKRKKLKKILEGEEKQINLRAPIRPSVLSI